MRVGQALVYASYGAPAAVLKYGAEVAPGAAAGCAGGGGLV
jgi:hypothetical protein